MAQDSQIWIRFVKQIVNSSAKLEQLLHQLHQLTESTHNIHRVEVVYSLRTHTESIVVCSRQSYWIIQPGMI